MNKFLRAIGFSSFKTARKSNMLVRYAVNHPTNRSITTIGSNIDVAQLDLEIGPSFGLTVIGEYENDTFHTEYYFPYIQGSVPNYEKKLVLEPLKDKTGYDGICDGDNYDFLMIFQLLNVADYIRHTWSNNYTLNNSYVAYSALSLDGTILFGFDSEAKGGQFDQFLEKRQSLISAARTGDVEAMEQLTLKEMDMYNSLSKRIQTTDLFTIVESSLMPYGVDSKSYSILGTIEAVEKYTNSLSKEELYMLQVKALNIDVNILINSKDLLGEPMVGRRFRGTIFLQGHVYLT